MTTTDSCGNPATVVSVPASGSVFALGTTTVTTTGTDTYGNSNQCTFTVTVVDNQPPVMSCPANILVNAAAGQCGSNVAFSVTATDNCDGAVAPVSVPASGSFFSLGVTIVTNTAADTHGNTNQCTFTVTVNDAQPPIITAIPPTVTVPASLGFCYATNVALGTLSASDNCAGVTITNNATAQFPVGTNLVKWTAVDASGNLTNYLQTVIVSDTQQPTITCPTNLTVAPDAGTNVATHVSLGTPSTTDNCPGVSVTNNAPAFFPLGTNSVMWTVTDTSSNQSTCQQQVIVVSTQAPVIACPSDVTVLTDTGACVATGVALGLPNATGGCGAASYTNNALALFPAGYPVGTNLVTWTATDSCDNIATCAQHVIVQDTQPPKINTNAGPHGARRAWFLLRDQRGAGGSRGHGQLRRGKPEQQCAGPIPDRHQFRDLDGEGRQRQHGLQRAECDRAGHPAADDQYERGPDCARQPGFLLRDQCDAAGPGGRRQLPRGKRQQQRAGPIPDRHQSRDLDGDGCQQQYGLQRAECDRAGHPAADDQHECRTLTVPANLGVCYATNVSQVIPNESDNCARVSVTNNAPAQFLVGTNIVTWTAVDASGNTATSTQNVIVQDTQRPNISCPADMIVVADQNQCYATGVSIGTASGSDNCGAVDIENNAVAQFAVGVDTVLWTAEDPSGNFSFCVQQITVLDTQPPTISCPPDLTLTNMSPVSNVDLGQPSANDNCSVTNVTNNAPATFPVGTTIVKWTATDASGNTANCEQRVTVGASGSGSLLTATRNPDGSLTLNYTGVASQQYHVQVSSNLAPSPNWMNLPGSTNPAAGNGAYTFTDTNTAQFNPRFYRTVSP